MKKLCGDCQLLALEMYLLRDMLIISLADKCLQEGLLRGSTIRTCQNAELS